MRKIIVLTALKDEYDQLLQVSLGSGEGTWTTHNNCKGRIVSSKQFTTSNANKFEVIATWATQMGEASAATLAMQLCEIYKPSCLAMTGICAGRRGECSLGDVVFPDKLYKYDSGKIIKSPDNTNFYSDMSLYRLPDRWVQCLQAFHTPHNTSWLNMRPQSLAGQINWVLLKLLCSVDDPRNDPEFSSACPDWSVVIKKIRKEKLINPSGLSLSKRGRHKAEELNLIGQSVHDEAKAFRIHVAPMATGSCVVEDDCLFDNLKGSVRKVICVDMEAAAVAAVGDVAQIPVLIAKGISDFADTDKDDRYRTFASRASAECMVGFIQMFLDELIPHQVPLTSCMEKTAWPTVPPHLAEQKSPNNLPRTIPIFVGREAEIAAIRVNVVENLASSVPTVVISSIDGMPGVGKTALAVHLAHILTPEYPDAQLYIDCFGYTAGHSPLTSDQIVDSLLFSLGISIKNIPKTSNEKTSFWRSVLASKRVIIIFDNVRSQSQVEPILPGTVGSIVLITSRNRLTGLIGAYPIPLDVLSEDDSVSLIKKAVGFDAINESTVVLSEIAKKCGYLPLALQIVAGPWRRRRSKYANSIITRLRDTQGRLESLHSENLAVTDVFDLSYNLLTDSEKKVFLMFGLHPGLDFTIEACAAMLDASVNATYEYVMSLADQSLVQETDQGRYRLHDLLRDFSINKNKFENTTLETDQAITQLIDFYIACTSHYDRILDPNRHRVRINPDYNANIFEISGFDSALRWLDQEINNLFSCLELAKHKIWRKSYWQLSQAMASYLVRSIQSWHVIDVHEQAVIFSLECGDDEMCASSLTELALAQLNAGDFIAAVKSFDEAEKYWTSLGNNEGLAYSMDGHGFALERLGRYNDALVKLDESLQVQEFCENKNGRAHAMNAIGAVYWRLGKYEEALPIFEEALHLRKSMKDLVGFGRTTNNIAFSHLRLGNTNKALAGFSRALELARENHDRHGETVTLNNLGYTAITLHNYDDATKSSIIALDLAKQIGDDYQVGRSYDVQGKSALAMGNSLHAIKMLQLAQQVFHRLNVPEATEVDDILLTLMNGQSTGSQQEVV